MTHSKLICTAVVVASIAGCTPRQQQNDTQKTNTTEPVATTETHGATTTAASAAPAQSTVGPANLPALEGELRLKTTGNKPETLDYAMKGDKIRLGLSKTPGKGDHAVDAIIDTDDQKATVLLNDRKQYVQVDLAKLANEVNQRVDSADVKRTGETASVDGRTCEKWKITDRDYRITACVIKGAPYINLAALEREGGFTAPPWVHSIVDKGYVPLRVSVADAQGKSLGEAQLTDTSSNVDAKQFEIPTGYTKTSVSKLTGK